MLGPDLKLNPTARNILSKHPSAPVVVADSVEVRSDMSKREQTPQWFFRVGIYLYQQLYSLQPELVINSVHFPELRKNPELCVILHLRARIEPFPMHSKVYHLNRLRVRLCSFPFGCYVELHGPQGGPQEFHSHVLSTQRLWCVDLAFSSLFAHYLNSDSQETRSSSTLTMTKKRKKKVSMLFTCHHCDSPCPIIWRSVNDCAWFVISHMLNY